MDSEIDVGYSQLEQDELLNNLSDEFMKVSIENQIKAEGVISEYEINYLEKYANRVNYLKSLYREDSEMINAINDANNDMHRSVFNMICKKFNFRNMEISGDWCSYVQALYDYFVINNSEFLVRAVLSFIKRNKKSLTSLYSKEKKDLDWSVYRKHLNMPKESVIVLKNIHLIVENFLNSETNGNELIELSLDGKLFTKTDYLINELFVPTDKVPLKYCIKDKTRDIMLKPFDKESPSYEMLLGKLKFELMQEFKTN